jgi:S-adenosyl-L-methionine hydrolase (adenosine-forming)
VIITLLTDFGLADHFVGVMKGVIAGIAPGAQVVDVSHEVPPFAILEGAFLLEQSWRYFPAGTIHVAVVDPGVGSSRRALLVEEGGHFFVGPDNGILSAVLGKKVRVLEEARYWLPEPSSTFHGRDIFAPVAAHLANGVKPAKFGPRIDDALRSPSLVPVRQSRRTWTGAVLRVDRFGNLITNFSQVEFSSIRNRPFVMKLGLEETELFASTYTNCPEGQLCVISGSCGYFEVSIAQESAAKRTGLRAGSPLELTVG